MYLPLTSLHGHPMSRSALFRNLAFCCILCLGTISCASNPPPGSKTDAQHDPLEPMNRAVFDVNDFMDRLLFKPVALLYRFVTPSYVRDRLSNVFDNMDEPVIMANSLLQGRVKDAGKSLARLAVNSTLGVGGAFDVAGEGIGWGQKPADFGQTLNSWGVGQGPYIILPFFGPSTLRDATGMGVDMYMSPWGYVAMEGPHSTSTAFKYSSIAVGALVKREAHIDDLEKLKEGSIDFYAQMRSVYLQYRNKQLGISTPMPTSANYDE